MGYMTIADDFAEELHVLLGVPTKLDTPFVEIRSIKQSGKSYVSFTAMGDELSAELVLHDNGTTELRRIKDRLVLGACQLADGTITHTKQERHPQQGLIGQPAPITEKSFAEDAQELRLQKAIAKRQDLLLRGQAVLAQQ